MPYPEHVLSGRQISLGWTRYHTFTLNKNEIGLL